VKTFLLALLITILLIVPSRANWGAGGCGPVGPVGVPQAAEYVWFKAKGGYTLHYAGVQIGAYVVKDRAYFKLLPGPTWEPGECPAQLPPGVCQCPGGCVCPPDNCQCDPDNCPCQKKRHESLTGLPPGGVETDKIRPNRHSVNGKDCSRKEMLDAIKKAEVPNDQGKLRLVVIGSEDQTKPILEQLKTLPEAQDFLITAYTPDHWAVKDSGLTAGHAFSIVALTPDGTVLHRQNDCEGGIVALAEALRDAKDGYNGTSDPDRRKSDPLAALIEKVKATPPEHLGLLALIAYLLWKYWKGK